MVAEIAALAVLAFAILAEWLHARRSRQIAMLAFGPTARPSVLAWMAPLLIALSSAGLPGLNGFVGEALVFFGAFDVAPALAIVATAGILLGAWYLLSMLKGVFFGPLREPHHEGHEVGDLDWREIAALAPILALCLILGLYPQPAIDAGIRTVFLRNGVVLSGDGGILPRLVTPFRFFVGGRLGSGRQWLSWVSIDDEVRVIRFLFDRTDVSGPVNVTGPSPVTNAQFTAALGATLQRPTVVPVPAFGARLVLGREMADELLLVSQRAVPSALTAAGYDFVHDDAATALRSVLGKRP